MTQTFTAVYIRHNEWYAAFADELPGANAQGKTLDEARENLRDAIELLLDAGSEPVSDLAPVEDRLGVSDQARRTTVREPLTIPIPA